MRLRNQRWSLRRLGGVAVSVLLMGGLLWFGGRSMLDAIAGAAIWPQVASVAIGILTYVLAACRWGALTDALVGRRVMTRADYLKLRVATGALGYFLPRELAESGGRVLWLKRVHDVRLAVATQSVVIDRLGDVAATAIGAASALALLLGWISATTAVATTLVLLLTICIVGPAVARWPIVSVGRWLMQSALLRVLRVGRLASFLDMAPIETAVLRNLLITSVAKYLLLLIRVILIGLAVNLPVEAMTLMALYPLGQLGYGVGVTPAGLGVFELGWLVLLRGLSEPGSVIAFLLLLRFNMIMAVVLLLPFTWSLKNRGNERKEFD